MNTISPRAAPSVKISFYLDQAQRCGLEAASATLHNVRDRSLRSEAAWRDMAKALEPTGETPATAEIAASAPSPSTPSFASFA